MDTEGCCRTLGFIFASLISSGLIFHMLFISKTHSVTILFQELLFMLLI